VEISKAPPQEETHSSEASVKSGMNSIHSISRPVTNARIGRSGIVVDAHRELRIKIYMGQVCIYCFPHAIPYAKPW